MQLSETTPDLQPLDFRVFQLASTFSQDNLLFPEFYRSTKQLEKSAVVFVYNTYNILLETHTPTVLSLTPTYAVNSITWPCRLSAWIDILTITQGPSFMFSPRNAHCFISIHDSIWQRPYRHSFWPFYGPVTE